MILDKLTESTKRRVDEFYKNNDVDQIKSIATQMANEESEDRKFRFGKALRSYPISFICEVKKASPSKGIIAEDFDYINIAKEYEKAGANAISVLTEPEYFKGDINYLKDISKVVDIPLLRKDFTIDEAMIYQAKLAGASGILLICSILNDRELREFKGIADNLGLSALVEAHDEEEVQRALEMGAEIIGVNNRNLKDFTVDIHNSIRLRNMVDKDITFVSESGIKNADNIKELVDNNVNAVLIGETFMRSNDKKGMLDNLLSKCI